MPSDHHITEYTYKLVENDSELKHAFELRRQVFVEEQGIAEDLVFDGRDAEAMHVVARHGEQVIGTGRVRFPEAGQAKLERMAVLKPFRGTGAGRGIMSFLIEELKRRQIKKVVLHAQYGAVGFYKACGCEALGSPFWEAGIKHLKMEMKI